MKIDDGKIIDGMPPMHPGEFLPDDLEAMEMTAEELDAALAVPAGAIAAVIAGHADIDADLALRLSHYLGTTARFWMNLQVTHDLKVAERDVGPEILRRVTPREVEPVPVAPVDDGPSR